MKLLQRKKSYLLALAFAPWGGSVKGGGLFKLYYRFAGEVWQRFKAEPSDRISYSSLGGIRYCRLI